MIAIRRSHERGHADHGWLQSQHSFSFADYHDPRWMGFSVLRVINEDRVAPGAGFATHGHRDMEIVSYVLDGELAHRDSLGNGSVIRPGDVQRMSAGTGVRHSEFNHSSDRSAHFLQIWIEPDRTGVEPSYEDRNFPQVDKRGRLRLVASPDGAEGSVRMHQDARLYVGLFDGDERARAPLAPGRHGYLHVARGEIEVDGHRLAAGDALMMRDETEVELGTGRQAEVLFFDLP